MIRDALERWAPVVALVALAAAGVACSPAASGDDLPVGRRPSGDGGADARATMDAAPDPRDFARPTLDVMALDRPTRDVRPNYDAFFADNPLPRYCGPDGGGAGPDGGAVDPGGTPECPDDLTREGCPCFTVGATRPCWPGLRVNRNRGVCRDGTSTCQPYDELSGRWGPCEGYVLPTPGATRGPGACQCFSEGRWEVANLSPCFITVGTGASAQIYAVSTYLNAMGQAQCPTLRPGAMPPFMPEPGQPFSTNALTVDCTGQFELCYTIKAGNPMRPAPTDCVVGRACTMGWYRERNTRQVLPVLPGWSGTDTACARRFQDVGGYGEMSVRGLSAECENIGEGAGYFVFNRVTYCPSLCNDERNRSRPECAMCGNGGSGMF